MGEVIIYLGDEEIRRENIYVLKEDDIEKLSWWERFLRWLRW